MAETSEAKSLSNGVDLMRKILVGDFDNSEQVEQERTAGQQVHPLAKHVTREFTHRVNNKPADSHGIYLLEESYYQYPEKSLEVKPLLFFIEPLGENDALLHSIEIPSRVEKRMSLTRMPNFPLILPN